ncbi:hypothetical protein GCM10023317_02010 [Actinopolymorpha pittospori]
MDADGDVEWTPTVTSNGRGQSFAGGVNSVAGARFALWARGISGARQRGDGMKEYPELAR